ncbi:ethanolamine ammonia-lyase subunit EutC [Litoribrevibacter albus]|uniref:Ethanolamine ammonia-lyase small subunit n=1 Tax=Litoribrevibacter albus TaxID=1473156 RepID=A0AA37W599_9GAMM|nr:ethanolamine ammonia-lyase subunit EutC [Litoribrevibacter albus]GLQ30370.1 ethanolamine ammonia-lyase light chain [Litoribrevibacter albus]
MKNVIDHPAKNTGENASEKNSVIENPWRKLRDFTDARIGLGRSGVSIPTKHLLEFQLAHAQAQDAVHLPLDTDDLTQSLCASGVLQSPEQAVLLHSQAEDRSVYLQRPDLGRRLDDHSISVLKEHSTSVLNKHSISVLSKHGSQFSTASTQEAYDLAVVVVDGLSSLAIQQNTAPFLTELYAALEADTQPWNLAPITIVQQGRVAVGDEVGALLHARCVLLLVGERPGLSSPDSLGLYLTWAPKVGLTDAARNCISNVRKAGLDYPDAVRKAMYLLKESRQLKLSGVKLKDRSEEGDLILDSQSTQITQSEHSEHSEQTGLESGTKTANEKNFLVSD